MTRLTILIPETPLDVGDNALPKVNHLHVECCRYEERGDRGSRLADVIHSFFVLEEDLDLRPTGHGKRCYSATADVIGL